MESSFYVIILLLIFLKLMIWLCVFYSRSRRRQTLRGNGAVIVQGVVLPAGADRDSDGIVRHEHFPGMYPTGLDNPALSAPPSYEEVQRTKSMEEKPPSYEQIASYYTMPADGMPQVSTIDIPNNGSAVPSNNQTLSAQLPAYSENDSIPSRSHSSSK